MTDMDTTSRWPALPDADWQDTATTLQLWMQILVGRRGWR